MKRQFTEEETRMAKKHIKNAQLHWKSGKCKLKSQRNTISQPSYWEKSK